MAHLVAQAQVTNHMVTAHSWCVTRLLHRRRRLRRRPAARRAPEGVGGGEVRPPRVMAGAGRLSSRIQGPIPDFMDCCNRIKLPPFISNFCNKATSC